MSIADARTIQNRHRRKLTRMASSLSNRQVIVTMAPAFEMLDSPRFGEAAAQTLSICFASAMGDTDHQQECFCCLEPWSMTRAVVAIGCAEFIKKPGKPPLHVLMFAICEQCSGDRVAMSAALKRDFGDYRNHQFGNWDGVNHDRRPANA